jgi:hypothetical protein
MTLVFEATPSSGGPRCLRGRRASVLSALSVLSSAGAAEATSLVVSVKGRTCPGTLVGPSVDSAGASAFCPCKISSANLCLIRFEPNKTHATTSSTATTSGTTTTTATSGAATTGRFGTLGTFLCRLRLAGKLNRDLAIKNVLAVQLTDGALSLGRS